MACGSGVRGFVILGGEGSVSGIQSVKRHRIDCGQQVQAGWVAWFCLAVEHCAPFLQENGRNTQWFGVGPIKPLADDRRCGDLTYSRSSLECGRHLWGTGDTLFWLLNMGCDERSTHNADAAESDYGRFPKIWVSSFAGRNAPRRARHCGFDILRRFTVILIGKTDCGCTRVPRCNHRE